MAKRRKKKYLPDYKYKIKVTRILDGDTFDCEIDLGFHVTARSRIRLLGLDTPETRGKRKTAKGLAVKSHVCDLIEQAKEVVMQTTKQGKFGRYLGTVWLDGMNLNEYLVENKMAKPYFGGKR